MSPEFPSSGSAEKPSERGTFIPCLGTHLLPGDVIVIGKFDTRPPFVIRANQVKAILEDMRKPLDPA